ncbi:MAG: hypothetical protein ISS31_04420 [Kiritimatiellae bacterium]|nr:hypothetical protein [Kiritimatiellia bacterium]
MQSEIIIKAIPLRGHEGSKTTTAAEAWNGERQKIQDRRRAVSTKHEELMQSIGDGKTTGLDAVKAVQDLRVKRDAVDVDELRLSFGKAEFDDAIHAANQKAAAKDRAAIAKREKGIREAMEAAGIDERQIHAAIVPDPEINTLKRHALEIGQHPRLANADIERVKVLTERIIRTFAI